MSPRTIEANEQIKDERRSQILLTALKIFTHKGFAAAKMSEIANESGVSYGLVYHYFKSKDAIYTELIEHAIDSLGKMIEKVKIDIEGPVEQIHEIAVRVFDSIENKEASGYYYMLMMNAITCESMPVSAARIIKESMARLTMFSDIISEGQEKGQIPEGDPMELAITCFSAVLGLASLKVSGTIPELPDLNILMRIFNISSK